MTVPRTLRPEVAVARPAHRDGNVLRWLAAYTTSMVGDSVYYIALAWAAVQAGTPSQAGARAGRRRRAAGPADAGRGSARRPVRAAQGRHRQRRRALRGDPRRWPALLFVTAPACGCWPCSPWSSAPSTPCSCPPWAPCRRASPSRDQLARVQGMRGPRAPLRAASWAPRSAGSRWRSAVARPRSALAGLLFAVSLALLVSVRLRPLPADDKAAAPGAHRPGANSWTDCATSAATACSPR